MNSSISDKNGGLNIDRHNELTITDHFSEMKNGKERKIYKYRIATSLCTIELMRRAFRSNLNHGYLWQLSYR